MMSKLYAPLQLLQNAQVVRTFGPEHTIDVSLKDLFSGCVGVLPIFNSREAVEKEFPGCEIAEYEME